MNRRVYCEYDFLKYFVTKIPKHSDLPQKKDPYASWRKLFQFLMKSFILIDISKLQLLEECKRNSILQYLFTSNPNYSCLGTKYPNIKTLNKHNIDSHNRFFSIFLTNSNKRIREEISSNLGIIILGKSDITHFEELFEENTFPIPKNCKFSWNNVPFKDIVRKSNSMIIVDNYILDDTKLLKKNFQDLLEILLPNNSEVEYHITVIGKLTGTVKSMTEKDGKLRYDKSHQILTEVCGKKNNLQFNYSIVDSNEFHDRIIITNNVWIDCGAGFNLIGLSGSTDKRTNVRIAFPFMSEGNQDWVNDAFFYLLSDCIKEKDAGNIYGEDKHPQNRLLTLL